MIKSIVGFGDSWIYGNEIGSDAPGDQYRLNNCILGQIGLRVNLPTVNLGRAGSSLTSMLWEFVRWVKTVDTPSDYLVVVGLTWDSRESWWPSDQSQSVYSGHKILYVESQENITSDVPTSWTDFVRHFILHSNHDDLCAMRYWQVVNFLDSYSHTHGIPLLQVNIARPTRTVFVDTLYDADSCLTDRLLQHEQTTGTNLHSPGRHPNEPGASFLSELIVSEIHRRKLIND